MKCMATGCDKHATINMDFCLTHSDMQEDYNKARIRQGKAIKKMKGEDMQAKEVMAWERQLLKPQIIGPKMTEEQKQKILKEFAESPMGTVPVSSYEDIEFIPAADERYNKPKMEPSANIEDIEKVIGSTEIYRRARALINSSQRRQIGYGMEKYPEPLNADTWSTIETIDHIIEESIDRLHYLVMLRIKLESQGE